MENSTGCVTNLSTRFVYDTALSANQPYLHFRGVYTQYSILRYFHGNDSLLLSDPWHSSYGWLQNEFQVKRE